MLNSEKEDEEIGGLETEKPPWYARHDTQTSEFTCHTSNVTHHTSHVTRHTSHVTRQTSHALRFIVSNKHPMRMRWDLFMVRPFIHDTFAYGNRYMSHVTFHMLHVSRHYSPVKFRSFYVTSDVHVTRHTSNVTRHTSHVTRHTSQVLLILYTFFLLPARIVIGALSCDVWHVTFGM